MSFNALKKAVKVFVPKVARAGASDASIGRTRLVAASVGLPAYAKVLWCEETPVRLSSSKWVRFGDVRPCVALPSSLLLLLLLFLLLGSVDIPFRRCS